MHFASNDALISTLAAFASFAVGFLARPLGAIIFGHLGDRIGRKKCLIITGTMIGLVTGIIGLLPDYFTIGIAAPILLTLLRLLQGVAVGGEGAVRSRWPSSTHRSSTRGRYAALPQIGSPIGTLLSSGGFLLVSLLPSESFDSWGWRIPFLAAFPLLYVAIWLRRRVEESLLFTQMMKEHDLASAPVKQVVTGALPQLLVGACSTLLGVGGFYLVTTFMIAYGTGTLGIEQSVLLTATLAAAAVEIVILIAGGRMVERVGAGRVTVIGGVVSAAVAFPVFWLVDTTSTAAVVFGIVLGIACVSIPYAASGELLTELFPRQAPIQRRRDLGQLRQRDQRIRASRGDRPLDRERRGVLVAGPAAGRDRLDHGRLRMGRAQDLAGGRRGGHPMIDRGATSAGHAIVNQLETLGVERVYCVPGESYLDVLDGLHDSTITTVVCRHEGGAGFMAVADSRLTKQLGVAMVTRGPGAADAAIAVHTAWQDATPLLLFVGLIPVSDRSRESFQEFDLAGWFGPAGSGGHRPP